MNVPGGRCIHHVHRLRDAGTPVVEISNYTGASIHSVRRPSEGRRRIHCGLFSSLGLSFCLNEESDLPSSDSHVFTEVCTFDLV